MLLDLSGNHIGNVGAQCVASMLTNNSTLLVVRHGLNQIGDEGAVAFANVLTSHNWTLLLLDLTENQVGDVGVTALARAVKLNSTLNSSLNSTLTHLWIKRNPTPMWGNGFWSSRWLK